MEKVKTMKWMEIILREETELATILLEEIENMQVEAFIKGYEYAIKVLQETIVKK